MLRYIWACSIMLRQGNKCSGKGKMWFSRNVIFSVNGKQCGSLLGPRRREEVMEAVAAEDLARAKERIAQERAERELAERGNC